MVLKNRTVFYHPRALNKEDRKSNSPNDYNRCVPLFGLASRLFHHFRQEAKGTSAHDWMSSVSCSRWVSLPAAFSWLVATPYTNLTSLLSARRPLRTTAEAQSWYGNSLRGRKQAIGFHGMALIEINKAFMVWFWWRPMTCLAQWQCNGDCKVDCSFSTLDRSMSVCTQSRQQLSYMITIHLTLLNGISFHFMAGRPISAVQ